MCVQYLTTANTEWVKTHFDLDLSMTSAQDIFPTYPGLIILKSHNTDRVAIGLARFGLLPPGQEKQPLEERPITPVWKPLLKSHHISMPGQSDITP